MPPSIAASLEPVVELPPPAFTELPSVRREGGLVQISFSVNRPTDVAVYIEDDAGRVVRHLVAGVLGKNPPPPLAADSPSQEVAWDGRDDRGRPAAGGPGGPFRVRVALGLEPSLDGFLNNRPMDIGSVRGLAPGPDGKMYVFHNYGRTHPGDGTTAVTVFSREGKYLKTIWPFPADLPDERLKGVRTVKLPGGGRSPFVYQFETHSFLPGLGDLPTNRPVVTAGGRLVFVGIQEGPRCFAQPGIARLTYLDLDGGVPDGGVLGPRIWPLTDTGGSLALSPDGGTFYVAGVRAGTHPNPPWHLFRCDNCDHAGRTWLHTEPIHAVLKCGPGDRRARVFAGRVGRSGASPGLLNDPVSVAVDAAGYVHVADLGNDRIAVFDRDGEFRAEVPVESPQRVEVSRRTGEIYVLSARAVDKERIELDLVKFDSWVTGRELARVTVRKPRRGIIPIRRPVIALEDTGTRPAIWLSGPFSRVEDLGDRFGDVESLYEGDIPSEERPGSVMELSMDRREGWLYVNNYWRYNTRTGERERIYTPGGRMWPDNSPISASGTAGLDGNYYSMFGARGAQVYRFDRDMNMDPFPTGSQYGSKPWIEKTDGHLRGFSRNRARGLTADYLGNVYVLWKKLGETSALRPGDRNLDHHRAHKLNVYAPDGRLLLDNLIDSQIPSISSPRLDPEGNIYVAIGLLPGREHLPPGLEGRVPSSARHRDFTNGLNSYPLIYGSVVKFSPAGGKVRYKAGGTRCNYAAGRPIDVAGAEWILPGCSVASSWATPKRWPGTVIVCLCESPCIDVDGFGRSFFPDAGRSRVGVADTAGNELCWFGAYGNADSAGPGSAVPTPAIPFCWPQAVAVDDHAAYVGDRLNRRIVRVKLGYRAEAIAPLPPPEVGMEKDINP